MAKLGDVGPGYRDHDFHGGKEYVTSIDKNNVTTIKVTDPARAGWRGFGKAPAQPKNKGGTLQHNISPYKGSEKH